MHGIGGMRHSREGGMPCHVNTNTLILTPTPQLHPRCHSREGPPVQFVQSRLHVLRRPPRRHGGAGPGTAHGDGREAAQLPAGWGGRGEMRGDEMRCDVMR